MAFTMEATGGTSGVRQRMKNALGRWSAQYQNDTPASLFTGVVDPVETNGHGTAAAFARAVEPEEEVAPEQAPTEDTTTAEPEAAADPGAGKSENREAKDQPPPQDPPRAEQQQQQQEHQQQKQGQQDRDREYAHFEPKAPPLTDYYEVLQISRNADPETIHRVYRIMVARFHPDNPRTGDPDRFQLLRRAYHVLSDPGRRSEYDRTFVWAETHTLPIFEMKEFVDGVDGEKNRRLGILSLLYHRRRINEQKPGISVLDLEQRMGFPREYLNFTLWYLKSKGLVRFEDNSDFGVTVEGVDYLETNSIQNTVIRELLEAGTKGETGTSACGRDN